MKTTNYQAPVDGALEPYDLAVIGGGVNGCGVARDAAGRGASTILFEQGDLAGATSSASTKLIHGGLRYLEHMKFRLVGEALQERAVLWRIAPHIIRPLRFVLPHHAGLRPKWMLRLGLFLYDHLGSRGGLAAARGLDLTRDAAGAVLQPQFRSGFEYSDCRVDDARLVVLNAVDAAERGAKILTRSRVSAIEAEDGLWRLSYQDADGQTHQVRARALVNAAGPWVAKTAGLAGARAARPVRLVKGSHIVTGRLFDHDRAYIFQNGDGRIVFAIPYEQDFTLIGTTDLDWSGDPREVAIDPGEIDYLRRAVSDYFRKPVTQDDVVWSYAGVRPLVDDGAGAAQEATRDYVLLLEAGQGRPPLLNVYGGKVTTYRRLAEAALEKLKPYLPSLAAPSWTGKTALPGGDFPVGGAGELVQTLSAGRPGLPKALVERLVRAYGRRAERVLGAASRLEDLGRLVAGDLSEAEVGYLMREEWAMTAEDVLWRRSKIGLRATPHQVAALEALMAELRASGAADPVPVPAKAAAGRG